MARKVDVFIVHMCYMKAIYFCICADPEHEIFSLNQMNSRRWIQYLRSQHWEQADQL